MVSISFGVFKRPLLSVIVVSIAAIAAASTATANTASPLVIPETLSACNSLILNLVIDCGFELDVSTLNAAWVVGGNLTNPGGGFDDNEYGVDSSDAYSGNLGLYAGADGPAMTLTQNISVTANTNYTISFELEQDLTTVSPYNNIFSASFDGQALTTLTNPASTAYNLYTYTFTPGSSGSAALVFSFEADTTWWSLDDVEVTPAATGTPEPASLALAGLGIAILALVARRRARTI